MKDKVIIFFTRIPTLGKTKTRLEPFLGKDLCVKLQTAFIKDIYKKIKNMGIDIIINHSEDGELDVLKNIIDDDAFFLKQEGKDLGERMYNAISFSLKQYENCILIGSDIPMITQQDIYLAFESIKTKDTVIAPTFDGGYYLIGMKEKNKDIFNMEYSTNSVFDETVDKIRSLGKTFGVGNIQLDIDDKNDFMKLYDLLIENDTISCDNTRKILMEIMREGVRKIG